MVNTQRANEELLTEIEQTAAAAPGRDGNRRITALEQFVTAPLTNKSRAVEVLCEVINKVGAIEPETTLVTKYLGRAAHSNGPALERLARFIEERHGGAIQCACRVLASLGGRAQARLGRSLARELLRRDVDDFVTEAIVAALKQLKHHDAKQAVTEELSRCLGAPDGLQIRNAVSILSTVGNKFVEPALVKVLRKLLDDYYRGYAATIRKDLCSYFVKIQSRSAVPGLLRGVERRSDRCFPEVVGALCDSYPEVQGDLLKLARRTSDIVVKSECLYGLAAMRKTKPRVKDVVAIVKDGDLKYGSLRQDFKKVLLRNSKESKPILLEMLRSNDEMRYEFAFEVVKEMDMSIAEVGKAVRGNPVLAMYNYFFEDRTGGLGLKALWEAKAKLGDGVKGTTKKFEHLLRHVLSCLGFITLDVDASGKAGVDTVGFPPTWSYVLLVGQTTGVVGDNLEKLANTVKEVKATLGKLARKIEILPIVATSMSEETNPKNEEYARKHGIVILRESDVDRLVEWATTDRTYKKLLAYLEGKAGKSRALSL